MQIKLFNTLSKNKEIFTPLCKKISIYVCGPTVYDYIHIGNARSLVIYDCLYRLMRHIYKKENVIYVRNITDIDDKIIHKAKDLQISPVDVSEKYTQAFYKDYKYLGCLDPDIQPKATEHMEEMISMISSLIDKDIAYITASGIYLNVSKIENYHCFCKASDAIDIEEDTQGKLNKADFVLWKFRDRAEYGYESKFGYGRPGWHIECSAMSTKYLGEEFDIHGGGIDLAFPHHTNEIAQNKGCFPNSKFANLWMHNGFLTTSGKKMSKSLGNFITIKDLYNVNPELIRFTLINTHYRKPLDYKDTNEAKSSMDYIYRALKYCDGLDATPSDKFLELLCDDLDTHKALQYIMELAYKIHKTYSAADANMLRACAGILGLGNNSYEQWFMADENSEILHIIKLRSEAKKRQDWKAADFFRSQLEEKNVILEDNKDGTTTWRRK